MSSISFVGDSGEQFSLSGIGEGQGKGKMSVKKEGQIVELHNLTIERKPSGTTAAVSEKAMQTIPGWLSLTSGSEEMLIEQHSLSKAIHKQLPQAEHADTRQAIGALFRTRGELPMVMPSVEELTAVFEQEGVDVQEKAERDEAVRRAELGLEPLTPTAEERAQTTETIRERARATAEWLHLHGNELVGELSWSISDLVKAKGAPVPIRAVRDASTGEISILVSLGVLMTGVDKAIKDVIRIANGKIEFLMRAAPKKTPPVGAQRTDEELEGIKEKRAQIEAEAGISKTLRKGGVPYVLDMWDVSYVKGNKTKHAYFMERCDSDLATAVTPPQGDFASPEEAVKALPLYAQLLDTLQKMHEIGWVHRDLKPTNVFVKGNEIRLADFGYAGRVGEPMLFRGTPGYFAPEFYQETLEGKPASPAADMWAFGVMLYYGMTGKTVIWTPIQDAIGIYTLDRNAAVTTLPMERDAMIENARTHNDEVLVTQIGTLYSKTISEVETEYQLMSENAVNDLLSEQNAEIEEATRQNKEPLEEQIIKEKYSQKIEQVEAKYQLMSKNAVNTWLSKRDVMIENARTHKDEALAKHIEEVVSETTGRVESNYQKKKAGAIKDFDATLENLRETMREKGAPLCGLIADLLSPIENERPTAQEARTRLDAILHDLEKPGFTVE